MITLNRVTIPNLGRETAAVLADVSIAFPKQARVGILALPGSGKSTLAKHFAGLDQPQYGQISIDGDVSWPLGTAGFLHPFLTVGQNLKTIARLKKVPTARYISWCLSFSDLANLQDTLVQDLTPSERSVLAYACAICLPWDLIIADEVITVGDPSIRMKCDAMLEEQWSRAGLVFLSRNPARLKEYCDQYFVLIQGKLKRCDDLDAGYQALSLNRSHPERTLAHV